MKFNQWTLGLAALGVISAASVATADEAKSSSLGTALSGTTISGYVDTSMQWNLGTGDSAAPGYGFGGAGKADGFNLNVVKLSLAKDPDAADAWAAGYKVDVLFGPDAQTVTGLGTSSSGTAGDFAIKQAYVELKAPVGTGLDIKLGVWDTIIGYEVFESLNNPNATRSWAYTMEPTTHTGVLLGYNVTETVAVQAGIANTYGPKINQRAQGLVTPGVPTPSETEKTFLASVSYTAPTNMGWISGSSVYGCIINGINSGSPSAGGVTAGQTSYYLGSTLSTPYQKLKLGASYDYVSNNKHYTATKGYAWAADAYALISIDDKTTLNLRAEYAVPNANTKASGVPSQVLALTATAQYDLWKNVVSRLELRWDHSLDGGREFGTTSVGQFTGTLANSYELIGSLVYKF